MIWNILAAFEFVAVVYCKLGLLHIIVQRQILFIVCCKFYLISILSCFLSLKAFLELLVPASNNFDDKFEQLTLATSRYLGNKIRISRASIWHQRSLKIYAYEKKSINSITLQLPQVDDSCQNSRKFGSYRGYRRRQGRDIGCSYPASNYAEQPEGTGWCRILKSTNNALPRKIFDDQTPAAWRPHWCRSVVPPDAPVQNTTEIIIFN